MNKTPENTPWLPRGISSLLVRWFVGPVDPRAADGRTRLGLLQGWVSVVVNGLLCLVKGVLGFALGSVALLADAVHSLSDVGSSFVVILGFHWARKPSDSQHPFGHGRVEFVTALVMAVLLMVMAIEFLKFGITRIIEPHPYSAPWWVIGIVTGTLILKQWLTLFALRLARATASQALKADYWHHLADLFSTVLVILALLLSRRGWSGADGWAGLGVSAFILWTGIQTARDAISPLLGEAPGPEEVLNIERVARSVPFVRGVHDIILHKYGDTHLVSLHIEVDAGKSALEIHDVSDEVEARISAQCGSTAIVHVDPVDRAHPYYRQAERTMKKVVEDHPEMAEFHDLRVQGPAQHLKLSVDVLAVLGTREAAYPEMEATVKQAIHKAIQGVTVINVTVKTGYSGK